MIEALVIRLIGAAAWSLVRKYWLPALIGLAGLAVVATVAIQHWRINSLVAARAQDQIAIDAAVTANASNTRAIAEIRQAEAADRALSVAADKRTKQISAETDAAIQELQNAPHANDPAGPLFDALGERLRALDAGRH